jgi:hypothetical protein
MQVAQPEPIVGQQGQFNNDFFASLFGFGPLPDSGTSGQQLGSESPMKGFGNNVSRRGGGFGTGFSGNQTLFGSPNTAQTSSPDISETLKKLLGGGLLGD